MRLLVGPKGLFVSTLLACGVFAGLALAEVTVIVDADKEIGPVNKGVFGNNLIAYDPLTYEDWTDVPYYGYMDHGAGIWDPSRRSPVPEVIGLSREAGISSLRFPGGCGVHHYDWKKAVGKEREHFLFGVDEFLAVCEATGVEPVMTVSYFTGDEQDAADLVAYLNLKPTAAISARSSAWAQARIDNGHAAPYGVRYFEIGNEVWHGDHRQVREVGPEAYAERYLKYYEAMKRFDPDILIGAVLLDREWNEKVLDRIGDKVDFGILHIYPAPPGSPRRIETMEPREIFRITLMESVPVQERSIGEALEILEEKAGRPVPLAITEFNAAFLQDKPVPYRHALGTALVNAELIRIFLKPENRVLMAHYWQFCNSYWGMVRSRCDYMDPEADVSYAKRPNYYVYEFYQKYFGDILVGAEVLADASGVDGSLSQNAEDMSAELPGNGPLISVTASRQDRRRVCIMVVNKDMERTCPVRFEIKNFAGADKAVLRTLRGPRVDATNEDDPGEVTVETKTLAVRGGRFDEELAPHSFTVVEVVTSRAEKADLRKKDRKKNRE